MTGLELLAELENGKILFKDFKVAYPKQYEFHGFGDNCMYINMTKFADGIIIESHGWRSAGQTKKDLFWDVFRNPTHWQVSDHDINVTPYPWSMQFI